MVSLVATANRLQMEKPPSLQWEMNENCGGIARVLIGWWFPCFIERKCCLHRTTGRTRRINSWISKIRTFEKCSLSAAPEVDRSKRQRSRSRQNMYIITCGNENEIVMDSETGYVPNNPLFGLPPAQLDKVSEQPTNVPPPTSPFWLALASIQSAEARSF